MTPCPDEQRWPHSHNPSLADVTVHQSVTSQLALTHSACPNSVLACINTCTITRVYAILQNALVHSIPRIIWLLMNFQVSWQLTRPWLAMASQGPVKSLRQWYTSLARISQNINCNRSHKPKPPHNRFPKVIYPSTYEKIHFLSNTKNVQWN